MMNKNLKTILVGVFTLIASTEMVYPIIFTGPGRRAAHRHEAEGAYAAGMTAGAAGGMMGAKNQEGYSADESDYSDNESDEDSDVAIQMDTMAPEYANSSENPYNPATPEQADLNEAFIVATPDANIFDEEEFLDQYGDNLLARGQAQEIAREQALNEPNEFTEEVVAVQYPVENNEEDVQQPMLSEDFNYENELPADQDLNRSQDNSEFINLEEPLIAENPFGFEQALQDAELDDDLAAALDDDVATQSIEPEVQAQPAAVPTLLAAPVEQIKVQAPAPVVAMPASEQIRIVKVYPVYDAARSAVKAVNNAVHDMINYVYSFVRTPQVAQSAPVEVTEPVTAQ